MSKNINIFVYGSLREGFFNYDIYLKGKVKSIRPAEISGFELYHMPYKGYPAVLPGNSTIVGEVVELENYDFLPGAKEAIESAIKLRRSNLNEYWN